MQELLSSGQRAHGHMFATSSGQRVQMSVIGARCSGHVHDQSLRATSAGRSVQSYFGTNSDQLVQDMFRAVFFCSEQRFGVTSSAQQMSLTCVLLASRNHSQLAGSSESCACVLNRYVFNKHEKNSKEDNLWSLHNLT
jgi:hypothetical protein